MSRRGGMFPIFSPCKKCLVKVMCSETCPAEYNHRALKNKLSLKTNIFIIKTYWASVRYAFRKAPSILETVVLGVSIIAIIVSYIVLIGMILNLLYYSLFGGDIEWWTSHVETVLRWVYAGMWE